MIEYGEFKDLDGLVLRNRYRRAIFNLIMLTIANTIVISMIFSQILEIRNIQTFATTSDGRVIEIFADQ
jgi:hypothetical protein